MKTVQFPHSCDGRPAYYKYRKLQLYRPHLRHQAQPPSCPAENVLEMLPSEIIFYVFEQGNIWPIDRLAFGFTCRKARDLLIEWRGARPSVSHLTHFQQQNVPEPADLNTSAENRQSEDFIVRFFEIDAWMNARRLIDNVRWKRTRCSFCPILVRHVHTLANMSWERTFLGNPIPCSLPFECRDEKDVLKLQLFALEGHHRILAMSFLLYPWMFLTGRGKRRCIGCPKIVSEFASEVCCAARHKLDVGGVLNRYFTCSNYPRCYQPQSLEVAWKATFIGRMLEGVVPDVGIQMCREYWKAQKECEQYHPAGLDIGAQ